MNTFICTISGVTPLLQHRFNEPEEAGAKTRKIHVKDEDPRDAAEKAAYRDGDGSLCMPGAAVSRLLREAGGAHKQRGSRKSLKYVIPAATLVLEDMIVLRDDEGAPLTSFEVDSRPVVIPATKGRVMRHRPRLNKWAMEFTIEVDEDMIDASTIHQLISEGGAKIGLGDYRPERGGPFGRFQVVQWGVMAQPQQLAEAAD
jgi:hypothetical protein